MFIFAFENVFYVALKKRRRKKEERHTIGDDFGFLFT